MGIPDWITPTMMNILLVAILVIITFYYAWTTRQMLKESRLQRLQEAEIRTMPQGIRTGLHGHANTIWVDIQGAYPITESSFEIKESGGNSMTTKGRVMGQWHDPYPGGKITYWINVEELNLSKYGTDKQFTLTVIVRFKSFLRNDYLVRFESEELYRDSESKLRPFKKRDDPEARWDDFRIVEFIPPWEFKKR